MVVSVRSAMVSSFCVRHASKRWFWQIVQVTMKHDPLDAMHESMHTLHLSCIHILCWSLIHWNTIIKSKSIPILLIIIENLQVQIEIPKK